MNLKYNEKLEWNASFLERLQNSKEREKIASAFLNQSFPIEEKELFDEVNFSAGYYEPVKEVPSCCDVFNEGIRFESHMNWSRRASLDQIERRYDPYARHRYWTPYFK